MTEQTTPESTETTSPLSLGLLGAVSLASTAVTVYTLQSTPPIWAGLVLGVSAVVGGSCMAVVAEMVSKKGEKLWDDMFDTGLGAQLVELNRKSKNVGYLVANIGAFMGLLKVGDMVRAENFTGSHVGILVASSLVVMGFNAFLAEMKIKTKKKNADLAKIETDPVASQIGLAPKP